MSNENEKNTEMQENAIVEGFIPYGIDVKATPGDLQPAIERLEDGAFLMHDNYSLVKDFYIGKKLKDYVVERFSNADDFVEFVKEYKQDGSKAFYDDEKVTVIFNYPQPGKADYSDSQATLFLKKTDAFRKFGAYTAHPLGQRDFIKFLKVMEGNITSHNGIELIELAENLKALKDVNSITKNAERGMQINIKVDSGLTNVTVPEKITLKLPVNEAMPDVMADFEIECFYTFDDDSGFKVELECYQKDQLVEDTTRATVKAIVERMGVKAYRI